MRDWPFAHLTPMKYGAILADPPWKYAMRSEKGHEKSPEAHYATMDLPAIKALPVHELAGPECYLFMWSALPTTTLSTSKYAASISTVMLSLLVYLNCSLIAA